MDPPIEGEDIITISGSPHIAGTSRGSQKRYVNELKTRDGTPHIPDPRAPKSQRIESQPITFTEDDALHVQFLHNDLMVITVHITNRRVHGALINNGSSCNVFLQSDPGEGRS